MKPAFFKSAADFRDWLARHHAGARELLMHYFGEVSFQRVGVLCGEYVLLDQLILLRRDGMLIKINVSWEEAWVSKTLDAHCASDFLLRRRDECLAKWDQLPSARNLPVMSGSYLANYFHWTLDFIPKRRLYNNAPGNKIIIPQSILKRRFQIDLLAKTMGNKEVIVFSEPIRVSDPIIGHELMSEEGIHWLRRTTQLRAKAGKRRIYLRRSTTGTRSGRGGGISESAEFMDFLKRHAFETIDFGDAEMTVEEQVRLLDEVGIILAPHGAALTNLVYLTPPTLVIELIGSRTPRVVYMHIASILRLGYYGIYSDRYDAEENVVVGSDELEDAMKEYR